MFDPYEFEQIDWDDAEDEAGNLLHCLRRNVDEQVVEDVLRERHAQVKLPLERAEYAIVGPDVGWSTLWTLLFDRSYKRGDWLRPVTGWPAKPNEIRAWERATGLTWGGKQ